MLRGQRTVLLCNSWNIGAGIVDPNVLGWETFGEKDFDEEKYIKAGRTALEAIYTFWLGLDENRKKLG